MLLYRNRTLSPCRIRGFDWPLAAAEEAFYLSSAPLVEPHFLAGNSVTQLQQTFFSTQQDSEVADVILVERATDTSGQITSASPFIFFDRCIHH